MMGFVAVTHAARSGARTGIQTVARGLAAGGEWTPVAWHRRCGYFHTLKPDWCANMDLPPGPEQLPGLVWADLRNWWAALRSGGMRWRFPADRLPGFRRGMWLLLPELMEGDDVAVMLAWARARGMRVAAIFHDAIPWLRPDLTERSREAHAAYQEALAGCDRVLAVSDFSAEALARFWGERGVAGGSVEAVRLPAEPLGVLRRTEVRTRSGIPARILSVGTLEPRKNHRVLLEAFRRMRVPAELELVGARYGARPEIAAEVEAACAADARIRWLGSIGPEAVAEAYVRCDFTIYPSILEGFGLPVLESLWHARPCVCANFGVMGENAREGGCLAVDVRDAAELASAMDVVVADANVYGRLAREAVERPLDGWDDYRRRLAERLCAHAI